MKKKPEPAKLVRCAIYTRKSTDEGLEQDFNSLDAQRESAEAYIASQTHEGWVALPKRYDDGGYTGGNMTRPALAELMADVELGVIDCVVVYKVDRLSRSLMDFSRIVETFDKHETSFVSVTQHFNTTSSMGRLTLNILLSFAQFEREIIGERIRDKMAASKKKGKHTGGMPVYGYDIDHENRRLVVNEEEAKLVRHVFSRFLQLGSATKLTKELNEQGHRTKSWTTVRGKVRKGGLWDKGHLYRMYNNVKYIGFVAHKGERYKGEHEAIVPKKLWDEVHRVLKENYRSRANRTRSKTPALLSGLVRCGHCGGSMGMTWTKTKGRCYRYYLCARASKRGYDTCPVRTIAAGQLETAVVDQLRAVLRTPEVIARTCRAAKSKLAEETERLRARKKELKKNKARSSEEHVELHDVEAQLREFEQASVTETEVIQALSNLDPVWEELFPAEQTRILKLLVEAVIVEAEGLEIRIHGQGLRSLVTELAHTEDAAG